MATLTIRWVTSADDNVCPVCEDLGVTGTWTFLLGHEEVGAMLTHPEHGVVWQQALGSVVHQRFGMKGKCRCTLDVTWDLRDWVELLTQIRDDLLKYRGEPLE